MSFNIRKATLQRVFEAAIKHVRNAKDDAMAWGTEFFSNDANVPGKSKNALIGAIRSSEPEVYSGVSNMPAYSPEEMDAKGAAYKAAFETKFQQIAAQFGLTYKAPGTTLRA